MDTAKNIRVVNGLVTILRELEEKDVQRAVKEAVDSAYARGD